MGGLSYELVPLYAGRKPTRESRMSNIPNSLAGTLGGAYTHVYYDFDVYIRSMWKKKKII